LFQEAVVLRDERARLLGCNNHAEYQMKGNMIDKPEDAKGLLEKFEKRILRIGVLQSLIEAKRNDPQDSDKDFYFWDYLYYQRKWQDTAYAIDHTKISEYFPLKPTIRGIFSLFQTLFGIVFRNIDGTVTKDAELYSVWDNEELGGGFLGYLYLDMYARPGKLVGGKCSSHP
jgi:metallopeptidase MepB